MSSRSHFLLFGVILVFVLLIYHPLFFTFYQQDEWIALGGILTTSLLEVLKNFTITKLLIGGRVLGLFIQYPLYSLFPFQISQFAFLSILLHAGNAFLIFLIARKISKNFILSLISAVYFACASVSDQSIIWFGASLTVLPNGLFSLLSIFFYTKSIGSKKKKYFYYSFVCFLVSALFKESSYFLPLFFVILEFLLNKRTPTIKEIFKKNLVYLVLMILSSLFIFPRIFLLKNQTGHIVSASGDSIQRVFANILFYPFETISQLFFSGEVIYSLAEKVVALRYKQLSEGFYLAITSQTIGGDLISILISIFILLLLLFIYYKRQNFRKIIILSLTFIILSLAPFIVFDKQTAFFESRYYYLPLVGGSMVFGLISVFIFDLLNKISFLSRRLQQALFIIIVLLACSSQIFLVRKHLTQQVEEADERLRFLSAISSLHPRLKNNPIFYISGNTDYYIGDNHVPFQQGIGYTLMVFYYNRSQIPKELIQKEYLWGLTDQGYKSIGGKGFGFYKDLKRLKKDAILFEKNFELIGIYYDGKNQKVTDISNKVMQELNL